jgi:hypothetical protein
MLKLQCSVCQVQIRANEVLLQAEKMYKLTQDVRLELQIAWPHLGSRRLADTLLLEKVQYGRLRLPEQRALRLHLGRCTLQQSSRLASWLF